MHIDHVALLVQNEYLVKVTALEIDRNLEMTWLGSQVVI
mgnify:CR=1 FL=1